MGTKTDISWTDATWNPVIGCSHVSEGCRNCYAENIARRFEFGDNGTDHGYYYDVVAAGKWNGRTVRRRTKFNPLTARKPRTIFVCSMGDLFHESVPDEWIDEVMAVVAMTPQHRYMILTKRPERMARYFDAGSDREFRAIRIMTTLDMFQDEFMDSPKYNFSLEERQDNAAIKIAQPNGWPLSNLALGVSVENQATADERIPLLLQTPAAYRFASYEPALGPVDLRFLHPSDAATEINALEGTHGLLRPHDGVCDKLDLVICGGESGPKARPMHPDWARSMRDQCRDAGVPFHFKQWGEYGPGHVRLGTGERVFRQFNDYQSWVNKGSTWVNGGVCLDMIGRTCRIGLDIRMAMDEGTFPVVVTHRIGKKAAGRMLDGVDHNGTINWMA